MTSSDDPKYIAELKPCPFCGSDDLKVRKASFGVQYVLCTDCGAEGPPRDNLHETSRMSEKIAVEQWNNRVEK